MDDANAAHKEDRKIKGSAMRKIYRVYFMFCWVEQIFVVFESTINNNVPEDILRLSKHSEQCGLSYRRWFQFQAVTQTRRWQNQILRSLPGGSLRHRAARPKKRQRRWSWGAEKRWWQLQQRLQLYHWPLSLHLLHHCRCQRWSRCQSLLCWGSSGCPAGCASLSPLSGLAPGCCCDGRTLEKEAHLTLL